MLQSFNRLLRKEVTGTEALHPNPPAVRQRNAGIDFLRVVAVFYVIVLHIIWRGGLFNAAAEGSYQSLVCAALSSVSLCAVNIFGLISGYVGYAEEERPIKFKKYLFLWLEVVFYNILLTLLTLWLRPEVMEQNDLVWMFLPVLSGDYWYFTAYTGLFLFIPLLNTAVRHSSDKVLLQLLACIIFLFCPLETLFGSFLTHGGYSFVWLMILYLIGAILKKTNLGSLLHPLAAAAGIAVFSFGAFLLRKWLGYFQIGIFSFDSEMFGSYAFPLHLMSAVLYVILFSRLKIGPITEKLIAFAAPGAFSAYIINCQRHVWNGYMKGHFISWAGSSPVGIATRVLLTAAVFVSVSLVVDYFRRLLFRAFWKKKS